MRNFAELLQKKINISKPKHQEPIIKRGRGIHIKTKREIELMRNSSKIVATVLREINDLISELGGFDYSKNKLQEFSDKAVAAIDGYDDSEAKNSLIKLVEFNVSRLK